MERAAEEVRASAGRGGGFVSSEPHETGLSLSARALPLSQPPSMALRRTLPLMMRSTQVSKGPIRYDVGPHMEKWWSKHKHMDGMIERHISPMEQKTVEPYFWNWGGRVRATVAHSPTPYAGSAAPDPVRSPCVADGQEVQR